MQARAMTTLPCINNELHTWSITVVVKQSQNFCSSSLCSFVNLSWPFLSGLYIYSDRVLPFVRSSPRPVEVLDDVTDCFQDSLANLFHV